MLVINPLSMPCSTQTRDSTIQLQQNQQHEVKDLIIRYLIICANEPISYFNDYFLNILQIEKYHFKVRNNNNIPITNYNNNNITHINTIISLLIPSLFSSVEQHYKSVATELHITYKHLSFTINEITHFLFTKFLKNCMECIINNNSKTFVLLPQVIFNHKYNLSHISNQFESVLTTLCHRKGIMAPILIPKFNITKYNIDTSNRQQQKQHLLYQQQHNQQQQFQPIQHTTHITYTRNNNNRNNNKNNNIQRSFQSMPTYNNNSNNNYYTKPIRNITYISNRYKQRRIAQQSRINCIRNNLNLLPQQIQPIYRSIPRYIPNDLDSVLSKYISNNNNNKLKYGEAELIKISHQISEYKKISDRFLCQTLGSKLNLEIISIYKIRNDKLFDDYKYRRESILRVLDNNLNQLNEKCLYHGTNINVIAKIITQGFLRQFTTRHLFGQGCYFAANASYSANPRYATPNSEGLQFIFVCNVVCGEYCKGNSNMKVPLVKPNTNNILYETTCNDIIKPSVFVTFNDNQAIPMYLIAFKNKNLNAIV